MWKFLNSLKAHRHVRMPTADVFFVRSCVHSIVLYVWLFIWFFFFYLDPKKGLCPFLRPKMKKITKFFPLTPSVIDVRHHHRHRYYGTRRNVLLFSNIFLNRKKPFAIRFCLSLVLPVRLVLTDKKKTKESNHRRRLIHPFLQTKKKHYIPHSVAIFNGRQHVVRSGSTILKKRTWKGSQNFEKKKKKVELLLWLIQLDFGVT